MAKKRANGEGSIRKRKDGRWEGRYTAGHDLETGKAIYKNVLGRTQAEVKEKLKTAIKETQFLDQSKAGKYTVGEWMEVWYEDYAKLKVRPSSHQTYRGYIDNHINPNIGDIPLEKLTSLDLQKLYKKLLTKGRVDRLEAKGQPKGLSAKTVRNIHQTLSLALELATGLRRGELLGLKWEDIDLERGDHQVKRHVVSMNKEVTGTPLKTKNAYRTLPLAEDTVSVLHMLHLVVADSISLAPSRRDRAHSLRGSSLSPLSIRDISS